MTLRVCPATNVVVLVKCKINNLLFQLVAVSTDGNVTGRPLSGDTRMSPTTGVHVRNSLYYIYIVSIEEVDRTQQ